MDEAALRQLDLVCAAEDAYRCRDAEEGVRLTDLAMAAGPPSSALWKLRGKCLRRAGRHAEAAESFRRGRALRGSCSDDLVLWEADALDAAGAAADALRLLREYLASGGPPEVVSQARAALARIEERAKRV